MVESYSRSNTIYKYVVQKQKNIEVPKEDLFVVQLRSDIIKDKLERLMQTIKSIFASKFLREL